MENKLREWIKADSRTMEQIGEAANVHYNTIARLIAPGFIPTDRRVSESLNKLARLYGYRVEVRLDFIPIGNGDENRP